MRLSKVISLLCIPACLVSLPLMADEGTEHHYDASTHQARQDKPDCEAMKDMDHAATPADDAVMKAMMEKCAAGKAKAKPDLKEGSAHDFDSSSHLKRQQKPAEMEKPAASPKKEGEGTLHKFDGSSHQNRE